MSLDNIGHTIFCFLIFFLFKKYLFLGSKSCHTSVICSLEPCGLVATKYIKLFSKIKEKLVQQKRILPLHSSFPNESSFCTYLCSKNIVVFSIFVWHDMTEICYQFFLKPYHGMIFLKILLNLGLFLFSKTIVSYQPSANMASGLRGCPELLTLPVITTD